MTHVTGIIVTQNFDYYALIIIKINYSVRHILFLKKSERVEDIRTKHFDAN